MTKITVLGGTGYVGSNVVENAAARGHEVTALSRTLPEHRVPGIHSPGFSDFERPIGKASPDPR